MKNGAFIILALTIAASWFVVQFIQMRTRHRIAMVRHNQISAMTDEIGKLKAAIESRAEETTSKSDMKDALDIVRLEGKIRDLRMENALARAEGNPSVYPEFLPILLLVFLSIQIETLDKRLHSQEKTPGV